MWHWHAVVRVWVRLRGLRGLLGGQRAIPPCAAGPFTCRPAGPLAPVVAAGPPRPPARSWRPRWHRPGACRPRGRRGAQRSCSAPPAQPALLLLLLGSYIRLAVRCVRCAGARGGLHRSQTGPRARCGCHHRTSQPHRWGLITWVQPAAPSTPLRHSRGLIIQTERAAPCLQKGSTRTRACRAMQGPLPLARTWRAPQASLMMHSHTAVNGHASLSVPAPDHALGPTRLVRLARAVLQRLDQIGHAAHATCGRHVQGI